MHGSIAAGGSASDQEQNALERQATPAPGAKEVPSHHGAPGAIAAGAI
jgi:hypothetical protein